MSTCRPSCSSDPTGLHRVLDDAAVLPQAAAAARHPARAVARRGADPRRAAQPRRRVVPPARAHARRRRRRSVRAEVLDIVAARGKMQNPETGSGGMLVGTVEEVGPESPARPRGRRPGRHPGLAHPDPAGDRGRPRPAGTAAASRSRATATPILFGRSIAAVLPDDLARRAQPRASWTSAVPRRSPRRVVEQYVDGEPASSPSSAARQVRLAEPRRRPRAGAARTIGVVPHEAEADLLAAPGSPTRSSSPTPATRSPCATPSPRPGDRPT